MYSIVYILPLQPRGLWQATMKKGEKMVEQNCRKYIARMYSQFVAVHPVTHISCRINVILYDTVKPQQPPWHDYHTILCCLASFDFSTIFSFMAVCHLMQDNNGEKNFLRRHNSLMPEFTLTTSQKKDNTSFVIVYSIFYFLTESLKRKVHGCSCERRMKLTHDTTINLRRKIMVMVGGDDDGARVHRANIPFLAASHHNNHVHSMSNKY